MPDRRRNTDRLIVLMAGAVLVLGGLVAWRVVGQGRLSAAEPTGTRALRQVRAELGSGAEVRYIEAGLGPVSCGYAAASHTARPVAFVSRPQRILFGDDALPREFAETRDRYCPGFARRPG
jgi:methyl coenzyme M reductase alpha subunit